MQINVNIHIIVPTFKEPSHVHQLVCDLQSQELTDFQAWFVNCCPGDETSRLLDASDDSRFHELKGQSDLFWTGAIELGQRAVETECNPDDFVLLMNCDIRLQSDHLSKQYAAILKHPNSMICPVTATDDRYISSGCRMTSWMLGTAEHYLRGSLNQPAQLEDFVSVDMLAGRSLIAPVKILRDVGFVDSEKLPHYAADYEYTARAKRHGYNLYVATAYSITNDDRNSGVKGDSPESSFVQRFKGLSSIRSPLNLKYRTRYVTSVYPWYAIPTGLFLNVMKIFVEVLFGGSMQKLFRKRGSN